MIPYTKDIILSSYFELLVSDNSAELLKFGHSRHFPLKYSLDSKKILVGELNFFNSVFYKNFSLTNFINPEKCEVQKSSRKKVVIILNCLDNCFGHALLKLFYALTLTRSKIDEFDILLIVPSGLRHFVKTKPGLNVLSINYSFSQLEKMYILNPEIDKIVSGYEGVFVGETETYGIFDKDLLLDFFNFFGEVAPSALKNKIIFYYRADYYRMWNGKGQMKNIIQLFVFLKQFFNNSIEFCVVGDLDTKKFPSWIRDERISSFSTASDFYYNDLFASSLICIGLTGSHMLFPSMFSECTVHLHPSHKYKNMAEDIVVGPHLNEMPSAYNHLYYFGNYNCSDLNPERLGNLLLFHFQGLMEKKYKADISETLSQAEWMEKHYPFFKLSEVNQYRKLFINKQAGRNRFRYYLEKLFLR